MLASFVSGGLLCSIGAAFFIADRFFFGSKDSIDL